MKKFFICFISIIILFSSVVCVSASDTEDSFVYPSMADINTYKQMIVNYYDITLSDTVCVVCKISSSQYNIYLWDKGSYNTFINAYYLFPNGYPGTGIPVYWAKIINSQLSSYGTGTVNSLRTNAGFDCVLYTSVNIFKQYESTPFIQPATPTLVSSIVESAKMIPRTLASSLQLLMPFGLSLLALGTLLIVLIRLLKNYLR